jgi:hypothetical protein
MAKSEKPPIEFKTPITPLGWEAVIAINQGPMA